jgi:hypothetical protein
MTLPLPFCYHSAMVERTRHPADERAEQEVLAALDILQDKFEHAKNHGFGLDGEQEAAFNKLEEALIHAREVALHWDKEARLNVTAARDFLREHYRREGGFEPLDLAHCDKAIAAIKEAERAHLIERVKFRLTTTKERSDKQRGKDEGRGRED